MKGKNYWFPVLLILFMIGVSTFSARTRRTEESSSESGLKFVTVARDQEFTYVFKIYPHPESSLLYVWIAAVKELITGKIVSVQTAQTMRGQENELHLKYTRDGSLIKIMLQIHRSKPKLRYIINRFVGDKLVYSCKGETKLEEFQKKNSVEKM